MKTRDLSKAEKLILWRRRQGISQTDAAYHFDVSFSLYRRWEQGHGGCPRVAIGKLKECEQFSLVRRRAGMSVTELAEAMGISRWWLTRMENGTAPLDRLQEYWKGTAAVAS